MESSNDVASAYQADLAHVHDDAFGFIATGAAKTLAAKLTERGLNQGLVVELACGSGVSSALLMSAGYDILGFDISTPMIELARERTIGVMPPQQSYAFGTPQSAAPSAEFRVQSLYEAELPECIAVTGVGEAFNYLFDPHAGFAAMCAVFERAYAALVPGGLLMFDVAQPGRAQPRIEHNVWNGSDWQVVSETIEYPEKRQLERRITTTRQTSAGDRVSIEVHELALHDHEEVFAALKGAGFAPLTLASYAEDYRFGVGHGGFMAVKPFASPSP